MRNNRSMLRLFAIFLALNSFIGHGARAISSASYIYDLENADNLELAKRGWNNFNAGYGKRGWNSFTGGYGKRSNLESENGLNEEDYDGESELGTDKATWNTDLSDALGKRAWNSGFAGSLGKRAWNSGFFGSLGKRSNAKRAWNSGFAGGMGKKRAWNSGFAGGLGKKRAWNSGFAGGMGKRSWKIGLPITSIETPSLQKFWQIAPLEQDILDHNTLHEKRKRSWSSLGIRGSWGKRSLPLESRYLVVAPTTLKGFQEKAKERTNGWVALQGLWGKRSSLNMFGFGSKPRAIPKVSEIELLSMTRNNWNNDKL